MAAQYASMKAAGELHLSAGNCLTMQFGPLIMWQCVLQALWTLHADGCEKLPMGQHSTYDRIKRKVAAALDPLGDNRQFQWSQR